jgi:hypothetical protein
MPDKELRRSVRRAISVPVRLMGQDIKGRDFTEDTSTLIVNWNGALIASSRPLAGEQVLVVLNRANSKESDFRIVGTRATTGSQPSQWGMECLNPHLDFWGLKSQARA